MKSYLVLPLAAIVFLSLTLLGGCTEKAELEAANRRMGDQLQNANAKLDAAEKIRKGLEADLADANHTIKHQEEAIATLTDERNKLRADYDSLNAKYLAALNGAKAPGPVAFVTGNALPKSLNDALEKWAKDHNTKFKYYPALGMVKFLDDDTFPPGSDDVKADAKKAMADLAKILNEPDALPFDIYLAGHTDDMPISKPSTKARHPNNRYLSVHRAVAVEDIFEKAGVSGGRIGTVGFDAFHPVAPNKPGHKGNAANRRVELWIVGPDKFVVPPAGTAAEPATETPEPAGPAATPPPVEKPAE
jgi:flagellar motor protein MotB